MTGSFLILAAFLDSLGDSVVSAINAKIHKLSLSRADREHPYGHGGYEVLGAIFQGLVLFLAAALLFWESLRALYEGGSRSFLDEQILVGSSVLFVGCLGGFFLSFFLARCEKNLHVKGERSAALLTDASHYKADALTNGMGLLGLLAIYYLDLPFLDALCGVLAAVFMVISIIPLLKRVVKDILHSEVDSATQDKITKIVLESDDRILGIHLLRTRQLGPILFADFHLKLPSQLRLVEAHVVEERVAEKLTKAFPRIDLFIHLDPDTEPDEEGL